jgi:hypothetical protein
VADPYITDQSLKVVLLKHVAHQAVTLAQLHLAAIAGYHASRVLATVLQSRQRIVELLVN